MTTESPTDAGTPKIPGPASSGPASSPSKTPQRFQWLRPLYEWFHPVLRSVRKNRLLIRTLFGVRVPSSLDVHFDPVTLGLARLLRSQATSADRSVLELGIGEGALISLALAKKQPINVSGIDCVAERVEMSKTVAAANHIPVHFFVSDLFSAVDPDERFDLIFMNPPYVPTQMGDSLNLEQRFSNHGRQVWDGGDDGLHVLTQLLEQGPAFLTERGRIAFGVQALFVPADKVKSLLNAKGLTLLKHQSYRFPPCDCYLVTPIKPERSFNFEHPMP